MESNTGGYRFLKNFEDTGKVFGMYDINCSPVLQLFRRSTKILEHLAIDGFEVTIWGRDRNKAGYSINNRAQILLAFAQRFLRINHRRHVCARAAIAMEFSVGVKYRLAARFHVHRGAIVSRGEIYEVTKWLAGIHRGPDSPPLLRFGFKVKRTFPGSGAKSRRRARPECIPGQHRKFVVWPRFPKPIRRRFGVVAELLFAVAQC